MKRDQESTGNLESVLCKPGFDLFDGSFVGDFKLWGRQVGRLSVTSGGGAASGTHLGDADAGKPVSQFRVFPG